MPVEYHSQQEEKEVLCFKRLWTSWWMGTQDYSRNFAKALAGCNFLNSSLIISMDGKFFLLFSISREHLYIFSCANAGKILKLLPSFFLLITKILILFRF